MHRLFSAVVAACLFVFTGCATVGPGYVGLKVNMYGENRGVDDYTISTGRVLYNPITHDIYKFPTFMQSQQWTHADGEQIQFGSQEGVNVEADIALTYKLTPEKVPEIFVEFRQNIDEITELYLRRKVQDAFIRHASEMKAIDIVGAKKQVLLDTVFEDLNTELRPKGFELDMIGFIGKLQVNQEVENSINLTIQASQRAIEAENKILQSQAEAKQRVAEAEGLAQSRVLEAKALAEATELKAGAEAKAIELVASANATKIRVEAEATKQANELLDLSITDKILKFEGVRNWDGSVPMVNGGQAVPFVNLPLEKE